MLPEFLLDSLNKQYSAYDIDIIKRGYQIKRYTTIRINTLKTTKEEMIKELKKLNYTFEYVDFSSDALIILDGDDIRQTKLYKDGLIYVQSLSSQIPVLYLNPLSGEDILDMTASPGSKTSQIAMLSHNKARITAVEKNKIRCDRLNYNLKKLGVNCATVLNSDALKLDEYFAFDKILLDAPCSGSGTISINDFKNESMFTKKRLEKMCDTQEKLLIKALKLLKPNGILVYSTCSILALENEHILKKVMRQYNVSIIPITFKDKHAHLLKSSIDGTITLAPNAYFEGFFIAVLKKNC